MSVLSKLSRYSPTNFHIKNPTLENPMADKLKVFFHDSEMTKKAAKEADTDARNLNKKELSEALYWTINKGDAKAGRITKALSQEAISALFDEEGIIADFLFQKPAPKIKATHSGNKVTIPGFGTFSTRYRKARTGTHPAYNKNKGEWRVPNAADLSASELAAKTTALNKKFKSGEIEIAATYVVSFKAGKGLKERASTKANK